MQGAKFEKKVVAIVIFKERKKKKANVAVFPGICHSLVKAPPPLEMLLQM